MKKKISTALFLILSACKTLNLQLDEAKLDCGKDAKKSSKYIQVLMPNGELAATEKIEVTNRRTGLKESHITSKGCFEYQAESSYVVTYKSDLGLYGKIIEQGEFDNIKKLDRLDGWKISLECPKENSFNGTLFNPVQWDKSKYKNLVVSVRDTRSENWRVFETDSLTFNGPYNDGPMDLEFQWGDPFNSNRLTKKTCSYKLDRTRPTLKASIPILSHNFIVNGGEDFVISADDESKSRLKYCIEKKDETCEPLESSNPISITTPRHGHWCIKLNSVDSAGNILPDQKYCGTSIDRLAIENIRNQSQKSLAGNEKDTFGKILFALRSIKAYENLNSSDERNLIYPELLENLVNGVGQTQLRGILRTEGMIDYIESNSKYRFRLKPSNELLMLNKDLKNLDTFKFESFERCGQTKIKAFDDYIFFNSNCSMGTLAFNGGKFSEPKTIDNSELENQSNNRIDFDISKNGRYLVTISNKQISLYEMKGSSFRKVSTHFSKILEKDAYFNSLNLSDDGKVIAIRKSSEVIILELKEESLSEHSLPISTYEVEFLKSKDQIQLLFLHFEGNAAKIYNSPYPFTQAPQAIQVPGFSSGLDPKPIGSKFLYRDSDNSLLFADQNSFTKLIYEEDEFKLIRDLRDEPQILEVKTIFNTPFSAFRTPEGIIGISNGENELIRHGFIPYSLNKTLSDNIPDTFNLESEGISYGIDGIRKFFSWDPLLGRLERNSSIEDEIPDQIPPTKTNKINKCKIFEKFSSLSHKYELKDPYFIVANEKVISLYSIDDKCTLTKLDEIGSPFEVKGILFHPIEYKVVLYSDISQFSVLQIKNDKLKEELNSYVDLNSYYLDAKWSTQWNYLIFQDTKQATILDRNFDKKFHLAVNISKYNLYHFAFYEKLKRFMFNLNSDISQIDSFRLVRNNWSVPTDIQEVKKQICDKVSQFIEGGFGINSWAFFEESDRQLCK